MVPSLHRQEKKRYVDGERRGGGGGGDKIITVTTKDMKQNEKHLSAEVIIDNLLGFDLSLQLL
jgi:hypothetical protein